MKEITTCRDLTKKNLYFEKDLELDLIRTNQDGIHVAKKKDIVIEDFTGYKDINRDISDNLDKLEEKVIFLYD